MINSLRKLFHGCFNINNNHSIIRLKEEQQQLVGAQGVVLLLIEEVGHSQGAPCPTSSLVC